MYLLTCKCPRPKHKLAHLFVVRIKRDVDFATGFEDASRFPSNGSVVAKNGAVFGEVGKLVLNSI